ncbi:MAG: ABC transporter substrate-binding protein [Thiohalocapsa sp.]|nr:ABC transporter substrate-binding protein [Thiohalocapsa sp.]MCF7992499.1 ABC transporter substrate-binding protein [Thiohalocapsa sp.]
MIKPLRSYALAALLLLIPWPQGAAASGADLSPPEQVIQGVSDELMHVLREDRRLLETDPAYVHRLVDRLFLPHVDFDRVCALVLGPFWRDATAEQRRAFQQAFKDLVVNTYAHAADELSAWEIRYLPVRASTRPDRVVVRTEVLRPRGNPVAVDYRMVRRDGRWLAYDVVVEGVSLLTNYRSAFTGIARERGLGGLIAELERRNATRTASQTSE